jgi:sec-independent protein translocase protein TatB
MFNVGGGELLVILLVALIVLGPKRLPEAARTVGKVVGEVRRLSTGFQRELREAFDDSQTTAPRRTESAPLASAVADLDAGDDEPDAPAEPHETVPADDVGDDTANGTASGNGNGSEAGDLAPEVADALDQVVAPPPADPAPPATPATPATPDGGDTPDAGGERAAS